MCHDKIISCIKVIFDGDRKNIFSPKSVQKILNELFTFTIFLEKSRRCIH